jgi:phosphatidylserine decarboxylase
MNSGNANKAAIRLALWSVAIVAGLFVAAWVGTTLGGFIIAHPTMLLVPWAVFLVVIIYTSRDPDPVEPSDLNAIVAPAHGKVDVIEEAAENDFMQGACKRISIKVALTDVQVQYAPIIGAVTQFTHQAAMKEGGPSAVENLFIGFDAVGRAGTKVAVRLIGGTWGRRISPWIKSNEVVSRSVRIGMMRPASRVDLYLPRAVKLHVNLGDQVAGGQSVVAKFE